MADRYARWLFPKGSVFSPSAAGVAALVERLRKEGWIADPASSGFAQLRFAGARASRAARSGAYAVRTVDLEPGMDAAARRLAGVEAAPARVSADWLDAPERDDLRLVWPVESGDPGALRYPLSLRPAGAVSYALEIHRCAEYVFPLADHVGLPPALCACKEDLSFEWDEDEVIPAFDGSAGILAVCEACARPFDPSAAAVTVGDPLGAPAQVLRGGAAHRFALRVDCGEQFVRSPELAFSPELVASVEDAFGRAFVQVATLY